MYARGKESEGIRNTQIREDLGQESVINIIERKGLGWLRIVRVSEDRKSNRY